jgi:hypothetical protein
MSTTIPVGTYYRGGSTCILSCTGFRSYAFTFTDRDSFIYEQWNIHDFSQQQCEDKAEDWALGEDG